MKIANLFKEKIEKMSKKIHCSDFFFQNKIPYYFISLYPIVTFVRRHATKTQNTMNGMDLVSFFIGVFKTK